MADEPGQKQLPDLSNPPAESHEAEMTPQHAVAQEEVPAVQEVADTAQSEHSTLAEKLHHEERSESGSGRGGALPHHLSQDEKDAAIDAEWTDDAGRSSGGRGGGRSSGNANSSARAATGSMHEPPSSKKESLWEKLSNAPRRIKEGAEELGARAESTYHEGRERPVMKKALEKNQKLTEINRIKMEENEENYRKGRTPKGLYETRKKMYAARQVAYDKQYEADKVPIEQKVNAEAQTILKGLQGGATAGDKTASAAILRGLSSTAAQVNAAGGTFGRPSPAPRFKPGEGTKKSSPTKGTVVSPGGRMNIDFGKGLSGLGINDTRGPVPTGKPAKENEGNPYNIFGKGGMFGPREEPAPKRHHKKKGK